MSPHIAALIGSQIILLSIIGLGAILYGVFFKLLFKNPKVIGIIAIIVLYFLSSFISFEVALESFKK